MTRDQLAAALLVPVAVAGREFRIHIKPAPGLSANFNSIHRFERFEEPVWFVLAQLVASKTPGAYGQDTRPNTSRTFDITRRVADNENLLSGELLSHQPARALLSYSGQLISILVIITKSTGSKKIPDSEAAQFEFRSEPNIPGKQTEHRRVGNGL